MPSILHNLRESKILVAAASRTETPDLARKALKLLKLPPTGQSADTFFDHLIIYPGILCLYGRFNCEGNKTQHFRELERKTGLDYKDMLFFDDEARNSEVQSLGVTFVLIGTEGLTKSNFEKGLEEWRRGRKSN